MMPMKNVLKFFLKKISITSPEFETEEELASLYVNNLISQTRRPFCKEVLDQLLWFLPIIYFEPRLEPWHPRLSMKVLYD